MILYYSLISAFLISLLSVVGITVLSLKDRVLKKILLFFVSFSAGALLGGAFFHLLPEAIEEFGNSLQIFQYTIIGIALFFILERFLRWHHCHKIGCQTHKHLGFLNLIGDGVHNLIDGIIIFSAFSVNAGLGISVSLSIAFHEIPQEIGDFGVLLYAGFKKTKALLYNFFSALSAILGVFIGYLLINKISGLNSFLLPFAAGGFIYISASDLIPEIHKEKNLKKALVSFLFFVMAIVFMLILAHA